MLMKKTWKKHINGLLCGGDIDYVYTGWFLFWIIPIFISRKEV